MELPILEKLKDGVKFDFATLAENVEQTEHFWEWWWKEKAKPDCISRPEIIEDGDPILTATLEQCAADLVSHSEFFDKTLSNLINNGLLPARGSIPRDAFRRLISQIVTNSSVILSGRPQIVFAGGGYGSGKTTVLNSLALSEKLPMGLAHHVGVDVFKSLIPEYNLIKAVADGRASLTVQKECQELASDLFEALVEAQRSFIWDSSMSNRDETIERLKLAQARNYELTMIAVLTPMQLAIKQAMTRAFDSRRFPHPEFLPKSHHGFREAFTNYLPYFDNVMVFARLDGSSSAMLVAEKGATKELVILDDDLFNRALRG